MTHYFMMKIRNKTELQKVASNHSYDIVFKDFMKIYKGYTEDSFSYFVNDTTLPSDNSLMFRKNIINMAVSEKIKTIDNKIEQNKTQYDLSKLLLVLFYHHEMLTAKPLKGL